MRRIGIVVVVVALLGSAGTWGSPVGAGSPAAPVRLVHGIGVVPGDNPVDVYLGEGGASTWELVPGGPIAYTEQLELGFVVGDWSVLLCTAVADPADSVEICPEGAVNAGGTEVSVPDADQVVLVAGYGPPEGEQLPVVFDLFEVDTSCLSVDQARFQIAHAAAMEELLVFIDGARGDLEPIGHGQSVTAGLPASSYEVLLATLGDEYFVLVDPDVEADAGATTFLVVIGPGDPTPLDPETTDLRFVQVDVGVEPCPEPPPPPSSSTTVVPDPDPPAPPQPEPPDFTG
jgi:hypothetical protein